MRLTAFAIFFGACVPGAVSLCAQTKLPPTPAEYGQFETVTGGGRGGGGVVLSPDGKWLAPSIARSNGNNELRLVKVADSSTKVVAFGTQPAFTQDSRWAVYGIGYSEKQTEALRKDNKPVRNKVGLTDLTTGTQTVVEGIESFALSPSGTHLAMRRYPADAAATPAAAGGRGGGRGAAPAADDDKPPVGATLIVRELATGRDLTFGNVTEFAWQDQKLTGKLLAMAIGTPDRTGDGLQLFNAETGALRVLDSASATYSGISWRRNSADLAVLKSKTDDLHEGPIGIAMEWKNLGLPNETARVYDPTADPKFPTGMRTVSWRRPTWSDDGETVFLGFAKWAAKPPAAKRAPRNSDAPGPAADDEDPAGVDVWHWRDTEVMPHQKLSARQNGQRNLLAAWSPDASPDAGTFVALGRSDTEQVTPIRHRKLALVEEWKDYAMDRTIGRPAADIYLVDLKTGDRTKIREKLMDDRSAQASPGGRYLLYFQDDHYWTVDTATRKTVNITKGVKTSFVDRESDETVKQKPSFGVAGWTKDDAGVILYDRLDLWSIAPDGSRAVKLTDGGKDEEIRHRYVRLNPDEEFIDLSKPFYLSLFGVWSKKSGYARLDPGAASDRHLISADKNIARLSKASNADVYAWLSETYEDPTSVFVAAADLTDPKQVMKTNPFQTQYAWGREELVEYKNSRGQRLQGALYYPAGYVAGRKYPMVVYLYEKLSDGLHHYSAPTERGYYNPAAITSHGYFLLMPDIVFRPREPGLSVADCVTAAVKKVIAGGAVDEKKVGVMGHSWGGFDTTFLATHTSIFAAAVAGAPITDLVSNYGNHHWSSGIAETDHIETGQQRMEVPLWEDLQAYIRNSALFNVQNMTTPLLIEVGDADGTVFYHQGIELYNVARRAKKEVVLIVYAGEDHGLSKRADQIDYQRRIFAWFGHFLNGETAPSWIAEGQSYLDRQRELKNLKPPAGPAPPPTQ